MSSVIVVIVFSPKNFLCLCLSVSHSLSLSLPFSIFPSLYLQLSPLLSVISFSLFTPLPFSFLPFPALLYCSFLFSSLLFSFLSSLFFPFLICSSHPNPLFSAPFCSSSSTSLTCGLHSCISCLLQQTRLCNLIQIISWMRLQRRVC